MISTIKTWLFLGAIFLLQVNVHARRRLPNSNLHLLQWSAVSGISACFVCYFFPYAGYLLRISHLPNNTRGSFLINWKKFTSPSILWCKNEWLDYINTHHNTMKQTNKNNFVCPLNLWSSTRMVWLLTYFRIPHHMYFTLN